MKRLRSTIEQFSRWNVLEVFVDRMEGHLETDFSVSIENAKALLESIGKEICRAKNVDLGTAPSINAVIKTAFRALGYSNEDLVNKISGSLATIGQELGNLRNEISPTSHGKPLDELRERNDKVDMLTREFLIDSTVIVAVFLIRAFEARNPNFFIAKPVAQKTGKKAMYSKAFDKQYYMDLLCKALKEHGGLSSQDINRLLWTKLPEWMTEAQKKYKVVNLLTELKNKNKIHNMGSLKKPQWLLLGEEHGV